MKIIFYSIAFSCLFIACDPQYREEMVIQNITGKQLIFYLNQGDSYYFDSLYLKSINVDIPLRFGFHNDSSQWVRAIIDHGQQFTLHDFYGTGKIRFEDSPTAYQRFKARYDTVYVENFICNKNLLDFDSWYQQIEREDHYSSAIFKITIVRGDVK